MQKNISLRQFNTFGLESRAQFFEEVKSTEELINIINNPIWKETPKFILGGGSNILFTRDIDALVIKIAIKGIDLIREDEDFVWLHAGAGEKWHDFVLYCVANDYAGVENLSLIPGTIGAAPMQNIGAYGVEIKDVVETVEAISIETAEMRTFSKEECLFGYRESIFKHALKGKLIITGVVFRLNKKPVYHVEYGDIQKTLAEMNVETPTIKAISEAVIRIRESKLPDPAKIGNAGSFFKNPIIDRHEFADVVAKHPDVVHYPTVDDKIKLAAGWLIEQCGWKGKIAGNTGTWKNQALVLVNHGGATGTEVFNFSEQIIDSVKSTFGVTLEREVNIL